MTHPLQDCLDQAEEALKDVLSQNHTECEDGFYSCPKHPDYFGNADRNTCQCHVEHTNPKIIQAVVLLLHQEREKAREEGYKEGYERGYINCQVNAGGYEDEIGAEPCNPRGGDCNGYRRAGDPHCAFIGCASRKDIDKSSIEARMREKV